MVSSEMIRILQIFILSWVVSSCGNGDSRAVFRIGIDPAWYGADFGPQTSYVNGYTEDLLLEMAAYGGLKFELIRADWDTLLNGLQKGAYDAVATTLPPYEYHRAKYEFSNNFLDIGPVLIVRASSLKTDLNEFEGDLVGILENDPAELILSKYPSLMIRNYRSIPEVLNALSQGEIEGALLDRIPAVNFVSDLYGGVLEIRGSPLTEEGIHFIGTKRTVAQMNQTLHSLEKRKVLDGLMKKWGL